MSVPPRAKSTDILSTEDRRRSMMALGEAGHWGAVFK